MLYLASKSPRRAELLRQVGLEPHLLDVDVPEVREPGERPEDYVRRVARDKARAGAGLLQAQAGSADGAPVVLGADTEVVLDDEVFGKPADAADAAAMLSRLAGRSHRVISAVCCVSGDREAEAMQVSNVTIAALSDADIEHYVASGEAFGKAGAYAIQGRAAAFITHLSGSHSSVMGLPLHETAALLRTFGIRI